MHISASQLKTAGDCLRLHWFQKVAGLDQGEPSAGAVRGKALHSLVERYLTTVDNVELGFADWIEVRGLHEHDLRHGIRSADSNPELPELRQRFINGDLTLYVEQEFRMSPVFLGYIDLVVYDPQQRTVTIHDHKFTSDRRYVPDEDTSRSDYQTAMYVKAIMEFFKLDEVTFEYDYYGTKSKWFKKVRNRLTRDELVPYWTRVVDATRIVLNNYTLPSMEHTTPNYLACTRFGGCEFRHICFEEK